LAFVVSVPSGFRFPISDFFNDPKTESTRPNVHLNLDRNLLPVLTSEQMVETCGMAEDSAKYAI